jgi:hypothetical protein
MNHVKRCEVGGDVDDKQGICRHNNADPQNPCQVNPNTLQLPLVKVIAIGLVKAGI